VAAALKLLPVINVFRAMANAETPIAERVERSHVFDMPDLAAMPTAATNDWMSAAYPGFPVTLPDG
jgi:hypothetical protein